MSTNKRINPPGTEAIYEAYKFSQAVVAGGRVDVAGQVGITTDMNIPDGIKEQTRQAFSNLKTVLEAAGSSLGKVTHITQYFTDIGEVSASDEVFVEFFPNDYPARTVVQVGALVLPQLKLEVQATATLED
ncbi:MAG: RidA family protein [Candidatus Binatia bacterium]